MKVLIALKSGIVRSLNLWKGILIVWISSLLLVSTLALSIKAALNSGFGKSMITEKLANGINLEVFSELGPAFKSVTSFFSAGLFMVILVGFLLNAFITGGLFDSLRGSRNKFSPGEFFSASAKNFWSFLVISLLISLMVLFLLFLIVIIPMSIAENTEGLSESVQFKTAIVVLSIFIILIAILLLVADYARVWQVALDRNECFKAIGFGFRRTFKTFLSSYPLMIILLIIQALFGFVMFRFIPVMRPATGGGVFLLFIFSQVLFFIKILLKVWRYGSVTALLEGG
jgi:hypothetical protein